MASELESKPEKKTAKKQKKKQKTNTNANKHHASVVQKVDGAIHRINHYPDDKFYQTSIELSIW